LPFPFILPTEAKLRSLTLHPSPQDAVGVALGKQVVGHSGLGGDREQPCPHHRGSPELPWALHGLLQGGTGLLKVGEGGQPLPAL